MKPKFCPRCHTLVGLPDFVMSGRVKVNGKMVVTCGNCKKGKVVLLPADLPQVEAPNGG